MLGSMLVPLQASRGQAGPQPLTVWQCTCAAEACHGAKDSHDGHNVRVPKLGAGLHIAQDLQVECKCSSRSVSTLQIGSRHAFKWLIH